MTLASLTTRTPGISQIFTTDKSDAAKSRTVTSKRRAVSEKVSPKALMTFIGFAVFMQVLCALFFTADTLMDIVYATPGVPQTLFLSFELLAVTSLWLAVVLGARQIVYLKRRNSRMEDQLRMFSVTVLES